MLSVLILITALVSPATPVDNTGKADTRHWPLYENALAAREAIFALPTQKVRFSFEATVAFPHDAEFPYLALDDEGTPFLSVLSSNVVTQSFHAGDRIRISGHATTKYQSNSDALGESITLIARATGASSFVKDASIGDIIAGKVDFCPVRLSGILTSCFTDDLDPRFFILILEENDRAVYCPLFCDQQVDKRRIYDLVGKCATITGLCHPHTPGIRPHAGHMVFIQSPADIQSEPALSEKIFHAPSIDRLDGMRSAEITGLGRHKATGRVVTTYGNGNIILEADNGAILNAQVVGNRLPPIGAFVEVLGLPNPDMFRINFIRTIWRLLPEASSTRAAPREEVFQSTELAGANLHPRFHGKSIKVVGVLSSSQSSADGNVFLFIDDGAQLVKAFLPADRGIRQGFEPGSIIELTGTCVIETDANITRDGITRMHGYFVVPPDSDSVRTVKAPPWWTTARLCILLAVVCAIVILIGLWSLLLKLTVNRKSRELECEISKRISSDIKVLERTRLAVELHDALSQTLTGVAMEIRAAAKVLVSAPDNCRTHLVRAERTVDSCRGELKNCIWDLRSDAIDAPDIEEAIRQTLAPHLGDATLTVRFPVERTRFTDNTAHTILRITRELAINAIRHGHASAIRVAGAIENGRFFFSVRDNGCGFDPDTAPGIAEGHFGLEGIRERIDSFEGELKITKCATGGSKVTVSIAIPTETTT